MNLLYTQNESSSKKIHIDYGWIQEVIGSCSSKVNNNVILEYSMSFDIVIAVSLHFDRIYWAAFIFDECAGAGHFRLVNGVIEERCQAILPSYQRIGIYSSVVELLSYHFDPMPITNDICHSEAMKNFWTKNSCVLFSADS